MSKKGGLIEALEVRRLLALVIDPIATIPLNEGNSASYEISIQQPVPARHRFHIDWGDGAEYTSPIYDQPVTSFVAPTHQFRDNGPSPGFAFGGEVTVWSLDADGLVIDEATRAFAQVVHNLPPSIANQPLIQRTVIEGQGLTFEYLQVDSGLDDVISVAVDWGDGDVTVTPAVRVPRPEFGYDSFPVKPSPYARAGAYPITVTSTDDDGGTLVEQSQVIVQRRFSIVGAFSVLADAEYSLQLRTTNPDSSQVDWLINWGDGTALEPIIVTMSATSSAIVTHTFAGPVSLAAHIIATPSEGTTAYPGVGRFVDVLGALPARPTLFGVEVSSNTTAGLPYQGLREVKIIWNSIVPDRIDTFEIERSLDGVSGWQTLVSEVTPDPSLTTSFTDSTATHTYFYRVRARYNGQDSDYAPVMAARFEADFGFEVSAAVQDDPAQITLHWTPADAATSGFNVYRKHANEKAWTLLGELAPSQVSYIDDNVSVGIDYEYRVDRVNVPGATASPGDIDRAFIMSGIRLALPVNDARRGAILVIDQTAFADPGVAAGIDQLKRDLIGERYEVALLLVQPSDDPRAAHTIRDRIESLTATMSTVPGAVILIGHVPAPFSGHGAYDFHADHGGAWSTDLFYGDLIATRGGLWWTDQDLVKPNRPANYNEPGDGKFDNDVVPDQIEVPVGRIDFFEPGRARELEFADIVSYLAKDHRYRTGQTAFVRDAVVDVRLTRGHSVRAGPQYTMYEGLVGGDAVDTRSWRDALQQPPIHQFAAAVAAGSWDRMFDATYAESSDGNLVSPFDPYQINALFVQATGSLFGDFYAYEHDVNSQNMLRYLLRSGEILTSVYVEAVPFEMHSFGLGESIGQTALRNWNSTGEYDRSDSTAHGSITLSLMGDPTLTMNPVQPVANASAAVMNGQVDLTWTGSAASYRVYRATSLDGDFEFLGETTEMNFTDTSPGLNRLYMVRAIQLVESRSGSYFAASTGVIVDSATRKPPIKNLPPMVSPTKPQTIRNAMRDLEDWMSIASA